jgi:hypothetical protein
LELESVPLAKTSAKLHGEVILECVAVGSPPPTIFWLKNDRPIAEANPTFDSEEMLNGVSPMRNPMFLQSAATSSKSMGFSMSKVKSKLPIRCIRPEDEGKYSCVADNDGRELASSTEVVIEEDDRSLDWKPECEFRLPAQEFIGKKARRGTPAYIHMSEAIHMEVIGNDIVLPCRSGGKPKPRVHWTNTEGQRVALGKKFQMNTMGDLVIKNLSWNEMGEYTCSVENPYGAESSATFLYPLLVSPPFTTLSNFIRQTPSPSSTSFPWIRHPNHHVTGSGSRGRGHGHERGHRGRGVTAT